MSFDPKAPILVVDDDPMMLNLVSRFLARRGFERIDTAQQIDIAQKMVCRRGYQLVISDLFVEPGGGLALLYTIRSLARLRTTRFLLMTGSVGASFAAMLVGADGFIMKPFTEAQLENKLELIARRPVRAA